jgi:hypothetical protein
MQSEKIKSPKTNRLIYIHGDAYFKLLNEGYTEDYLLSLPRVTANKPMSPKYNKNNQMNSTILDLNKTTITPLPEIDSLMLLQLSYKDLYNTCLINKSLYKICLNDKILHLRLKAYKLYEQLKNKKKIEFMDVDRKIVDKYSTWVNYYDLNTVKLKISISLKYGINYITYYNDIKPDKYGKYGGGPVSINKNKWLDFIYDLLASNTEVSIKNV